MGRRLCLHLRQIPIIGPKVLQVIGLQKSNQFLAALCLQRLPDINLSYSRKPFLGENPREHKQRPGEIGSIQFSQFPEPHND